jgi:peptidoglycan/xylan/chitin deacetylase (PgdA/CDA1 family)
MRPAEPTVQEFDAQMRILRDYFSPLPLVEAVDRLRSGTLPVGAVCVTFDDGYADNLTCAMPILRKHNVPATVFVSTAFLNGGRMWNDTVIEVLRHFGEASLDLRDIDLGCYPLRSMQERLQAVDTILHDIKHLDPEVRLSKVSEIEKRAGDLPHNLMLTDAQIQSLVSNSVSIGAHTVNHPILSSIDDETARLEMDRSKQYLESLVQQEVEVFAYPNGRPNVDYSLKHRDLVKTLGFKAAVSTHWGVSIQQSDIYQLPRFTPWDRQPFKFGFRLLANCRRIDPLIGTRG